MGIGGSHRRKPLVAILCHGGSQCDRPSQFAAETFIRAVSGAGGSVMLVPAIPEAVDPALIADVCDALLMTGSRSNVSPALYGADNEEPDEDPGRDRVALDVAARMIAREKPVLGICRGMQELNVLHGGTLRGVGEHGLHMIDLDWRDTAIFAHLHEIEITCPRLASVGGVRQNIVSAHRQGVDRLGLSLNAAAFAADGLIEGFSTGRDGRVVGVQWHPERLRAPIDHALFNGLIAYA